MSDSNATTLICSHCGRPIAHNALWLSGGPYHPECCESPYKGENDPLGYIEDVYTPPPANLDGTLKIGIEATLEMLRIIDERIDNIERMLSEDKDSETEQ